jgi:hypothetical protein
MYPPVRHTVCAPDLSNVEGYIEQTVQYVVDAGGIVQEADYPYLAQNSYCQ